MPDKKTETEKDVDEIVKDLNEVGTEDGRAPGMPAEPAPPGPQGPRPNPMQLNHLEMQDINEMMMVVQQNALQIGSLTVAVHQIEAQQEKLDKQKANMEKQKANILEQQKEQLVQADNHKQAIDRILEKARKRLNLPDDRVYGIDQKTWTFIDQGARPQ